jgi:tetratricopeptide (TPR) repeat protein
MLLRVSWSEQAEQAKERYERASARDLDQRQLTQLANAAWAAGLCLLMDGRRDEARDWLRTAARRYRESWDAGAPPDAWGRPIAAMKALLIAGDDAKDAARWALDAGSPAAASPIGRYAAALAHLVLGEDVEARTVAATLRSEESFPGAVADALVTIAAADRAGYLLAVEDVLESFERRSGFLEDVRVADTVLVLQRLADARGCAVDLAPSVLIAPAAA